MPDRDTAFSKARTYTLLIMVFIGISAIQEAIVVVRRLIALPVLFGAGAKLAGSEYENMTNVMLTIAVVVLVIGIIVTAFKVYLIYKFYDNWLDISNEEIPELVAWRLLLRIIGISAFLASLRFFVLSSAPFAYLADMAVLGVLGLFCYLGYNSLETLAYVLSTERIVSSGFYSDYQERPEDSFYYTEDSEDSYYQDYNSEGFNGFDVDERYDDLP